MPTRFHPLILLALVVLLGASGCATYSDTMRDAHAAVAAGQAQRAEQIINETLKTENSGQLPPEFNEDHVLLLLERATILQALGEYRLAARDMMVVDDRMVFLSIAESDSLELAKYLYSDDSQAYVAPAYERLLVNTLNMLNYLGMGDIQGAKVEARRFALMERFYLDADEPALLSGIVGLGNYLGGVAFEHARDYSEAARYYSRAWYYGVRSDEFHSRLVHLLQLTGYKPNDLLASVGPEALKDLLDSVRTAQRIDFAEYRARYLNGDTLIVVQTGLAPWRVAQRLPIGAAMGYAHNLSSDNQTQAAAMIASGALDSVNFPMLTTQGLPGNKSVTVSVGQTSVTPHIDIDVAAQVSAGYAHILPKLMTAAITRLITRIAAGQVTRAAVNATGSNELFGALAGLVVQGTMNAMDTPDTRSWMTLPAHIRLIRLKLPAQTQTIHVLVGATSDERQVEILEESLNLVNFSRIR